MDEWRSDWCQMDGIEAVDREATKSYVWICFLDEPPVVPVTIQEGEGRRDFWGEGCEDRVKMRRKWIR